MTDTRPDISAIVPLGRRYGNVSELLDKYAEIIQQQGLQFEMIVVLDGPHAGMGIELARLKASMPWLRVVELAREFGESAALTAGFAEASGQTILTLPGYEQVAPSELAKLIATSPAADMAIAVRWPRKGSFLARLRRAMFHGFVKLLTGQRYRDLSCGMRRFKRDVADEIPLYSDRHHFYPVLAGSRGFTVSEVQVVQGSDDGSRVPGSMVQNLHRMLDILTLFFLVRFTKKPLRFFGTVGFLVGALGVVFLSVLIVQRLFFGIGLADRPALLLSSLMLVLGVQIFALGLIGELIIFTHAKELKEYAVRRVIGGETSSARDDDQPGKKPDKDS